MITRQKSKRRLTIFSKNVYFSPAPEGVTKKTAAPGRSKTLKKEEKKAMPTKKTAAKKTAAKGKTTASRKASGAAAAVKKKAAPAKKAAARKAAPAKKTAAAKKPAARKAAKPRAQSKASFKKEMTATLLEAKARILSGVTQKVRSESTVLKPEMGDIYDIASSERERDLALTLGDRDRKKLGEIERALERIEDGTYGECEECGEPVEQGRLKALPFTRVCVECQSRLEREQKIKGRFDEETGLGIEKSENEDDEF